MKRLIYILMLFITVHSFSQDWKVYNTEDGYWHYMNEQGGVYTKEDGNVFWDDWMIINKDSAIIAQDYANIFIQATGITGNDSLGVIYLVDALIDSSLWDKMDIIYPSVGGTASTHPFNLIDTSLYKILFTGTSLHDSKGFGANTNGYGNTFFSLSNLDTASFHMSFYSQTDNFNGASPLEGDMGVSSASGGLELSLSYYQSNVVPDQRYLRNIVSKDAQYIIPINNSQGYVITNRNGGVNHVYLEGIKVGKKPVTTYDFVDDSIFINGLNSDGSLAYPSTRQCSFASIGQGLTDKEAYQLSRIVDSFQVIVGREINVPGRIKEQAYSTYPISIITSEDAPFSPATSITNNLRHWVDSMKLGVIAHWNIRSYNWGLDNYNNSPYIIPVSVDSFLIGNWMAHFDTLNVDYVTFTMYGETGFSLRPFTKPLTERLVERHYPYMYFDTRNNPHLGDDLFDRIVDSCRAHGIEPIPYVSPMRNAQICDEGGTFNCFDSLDAVHYDNWLVAYLQELITDLDLRYIWLDGFDSDELTTDGKRTINDMQYIYDGIKAIDTNCMLIMNVIADTGFTRYPYDIGSNEQYAFYTFSDDNYREVLDTNRFHNGTRYYIPEEIVAALDENNYWYYREGIFTYKDWDSDLAYLWDSAGYYNSNFHLSLAPDENGKIEPEQWVIWRDMLDTVAPLFQTAEVFNLKRNEIVLRYNEGLCRKGTAVTDYTPSQSKSVTNVHVDDSVITLTVNSDFLEGDNITIGYSQGVIQDYAMNLAGNLSGQSVTNNITDTLEFQSEQGVSNNQFTIYYHMAVGNTCYVDFGDGAGAQAFTADSTDRNISSNYTVPSTTYTIKIYGDTEGFRRFYFNENTIRNLNVSEFSLYTPDIIYLRLVGGAGVTENTGNINDLSGLTNMNFLYLDNLSNSMTGSVNNLPSSLTTYLYFNNLGEGITVTSDPIPDWSTATISIKSQLTTAELDNLLIQLAASATSSLTRTWDFRGTNQARSSASDAAVSTLNALNKTIQTN